MGCTSLVGDGVRLKYALPQRRWDSAVQSKSSQVTGTELARTEIGVHCATWQLYEGLNDYISAPADR